MFCSVDNCDSKHYANGYCQRHYQQIKIHGKIITLVKRTPYDPNEFIIDKNICWIILYNARGEEIAKAKIDVKYYDQIKEYKWRLHKKKYAVTTLYDLNNQPYIGFLHQAIIQLSGQKVPDGFEIDHKDTDRLNCLEENLRICTHTQNLKNQGIRCDSTSGYKGVSWNTQRKKFEAYIMENYKKIHLGFFDIADDAANVYNSAAIKYFGEFAKLNIIKENIK